MGLAVLLGYYSLLAAGASLAHRRPELAALAPWLADAAGLAVGLVLTWRARSL